MLKIKSLSLKNFKSIGENTQTIEFAPITLLFGANGAGKSTIIQALAFLNEVINHRNYDPIKTEVGGDAMDLGGFLNLVHKKQKDRSIEIGIGFDLEGNEINDLFIQLVPIEYQLEYSRDSDYWSDFYGYKKWLNEINNMELNFKISWDDKTGKSFIQEYEIWLDMTLFSRINFDGESTKIQYMDLNHKSINPRFNLLFSDKSKIFQGINFYKPLIDNESIFQSLMKKENSLKKFTDSEIYELLLHFSLCNQKNSKLSDDFYEKLYTENLVKLTTLSTFDGKHNDIIKVVLGHLNKLYDSNDNNKMDTNEKEILLETIRFISSFYYGTSLNPAINIIKQSDAMPIANDEVFFDMEWKELDELDDNDPTEDEHDLKMKQTIITNFLGNLITSPLTIASHFLDTFTYIGPLRALPLREIKPQETYDRSLWSKGLEAWNVLYKNEDYIVDQVNKWMEKDRIYTGYKVKAEHDFNLSENEIDNLIRMEPAETPEEHKKIKSKFPFKIKLSLKDLNNNIPVMLQDIGVGISQLLPIIVVSCQNNDLNRVTQMVAIEQPELHIHPALQVELADLFICASKTNNKMFLIETHSEHLMLRFLRRIRETTEKRAPEKLGLKKEDVSIIYVEPDQFGTFLSSIHTDEDGEFVERWPRGFFSERRMEYM